MGGQLDGRVAAVTGGGTGLGEAIARRFAAEGALVVVSGRRREPIDAVAADIGGMAVVTDVADEASVAALFAKTEQSHGRLDILVNNAGHGGGGLMPVENMDIDEWDRTFAVNVRGVVLCSKYAIPLIKRGGGGAIVHIASVAGIGPLKNQSVYGVSKAAVIALTKPMAHEVGRDGIRVNALCPGGGGDGSLSGKRGGAAGGDRRHRGGRHGPHCRRRCPRPADHPRGGGLQHPVPGHRGVGLHDRQHPGAGRGQAVMPASAGSGPV